MANPGVEGGAAHPVTLPPLRNIDSSDTMSRGSLHAPGAAPAVSDERSVLDSRSSPDVRSARTGVISSGYSTSPPPMPPAPLPMHAAPVYAPELHRSGSREGLAQHGYYGFVPRSATGHTVIAPPENGAMMSLERINTAALALYHFSREHLEAQVLPPADVVQAVLPAVSDINYEMRTFSAHDPRLRELSDVASSYPRPPPVFWPSTRDDRDSRRLDDPRDTEKVPLRHSPPNKPPLRLPRVRSGDDIAVSRVSSGSFDMSYDHPARVDAMYSIPYTQASPARQSGDQTLPYVPKYRKRSRAPAPGVCHSCGNNETPEWRRGPDGARTLCNACGLHFSKLVRRRALKYRDAPPGTQIPQVTIAELRASINVGSDGPRSNSQRRSTDTPANSAPGEAPAPAPAAPERNDSETAS